MNQQDSNKPKDRSQSLATGSSKSQSGKRSLSQKTNGYGKQYDFGWKRLLFRCFYPLLKFFLPELYQAMDTSRNLEFLDTELQKISPNGKTGPRYPDVLVKVPAKFEKNHYILCHIELQSTESSKINERMFSYAYKIYNKLGIHPISILFMSDTNPEFRPGEYFHESMIGNDLRFRVVLVKTLDWIHKLDELKHTNELGAQVLYVFLTFQNQAERLRRSKRTIKDSIPESVEVQKLEVKKQLFEHLVKLDMDWTYIQELLYFLDWLLVLIPEHDQQFYDFQLKVLSPKEEAMAYMFTPERVGFRNGKEVGKELGKGLGKLEQSQDTLIKQINKKFLISNPEVDRIRNCQSLDRLNDALDAFVFAETKTEVLDKL